MKYRTLLVVGPATLAVLAVAVGSALATPSSGLSATPHVVGAALAEGVNVNADRIKFQTKDPAEVSVVTITLQPGGTTGWHRHPGLALIAVAEGTGELHFADCSSETFSAGEAFVEAGDDPPTVFINESPEPVTLTVTFVSPKGAGFHRDAANPGCAVS